MTARYRAPSRRAGPQAVVARLRRHGAIGAIEEALIGSLEDWRPDPPGVELIRDARSATPRLLLSGWAAKVRWLSDGRRQIVSFVLPGDGLALHQRPHPLGLCPVVALTPVQTVDAAPLLRATAQLPATAPLRQALDAAAGLEEVWLLDQVIRLGRLAAYERMAHLIMELRWRLTAVELGVGDQFPFPLTQETLADALGLSIVHVNRTLQQMRREKLIELQNGRLRVLDPVAMAQLCDFREPQPQTWLPAAAA